MKPLSIHVYSLLLLLAVAGCSKSADSQPENVIMPENLSITQSMATGKVVLSWSNPNSSVDGFEVSYKPVGTEQYVALAKLPADARSYVVDQEIAPDASYYFAVAALRGDSRSYPATSLYKVIKADAIKGVRILRTYASHAGVGIEYEPANLFVGERKSFGLIVTRTPEESAEPILDIPAPADLKGKSGCMQMIPITRLPKDATEIYVRAYALGDKSRYVSEPSKVVLPEQPAAIKLDWKEVTPDGLKGKVEVYSTTSTLNGRPFNAWYAVGNPEKSRIKRNDPSTNTSLTEQAKQLSKALVLVNGSYFYMNTTLGIYGHNGLKGVNQPLRGSLRTQHPEYNVMYPAMRGFFGVTKEGDARIYWGGSEAGEPHLYEHPMPILLGEARYDSYLPEIVGKPVEWVPYYGLSGGPVVLKDGRVPVDFTPFREGDEYYLANFELMPYDIFGSDIRPDRTAVGIREDGRIVLFVCDGRILESKGADLVELAQIMKGLGCKDALNLDGGGSTNMWVSGEIVNHKDIVPATGDTRAIKSIIGFFEK